mmetsp:Transcript_63554/g.177877  ORF Transcript_63554/g.177877 Transcript_63554/m.177877 type:complete len:132 (-) Transcript_63554:204-599(-)
MALPMKKVAAMKVAMKKVAAMKSGRPMKKAKRVSVVAKGVRAKSSVFSGRKEKTSGGLKKENLTQSKTGKVVSKKASAAAKARYAKSRVKAWAEAVQAARKALGITGFVAIGGKSASGKALYAKAKSIYGA